MALVVADRVKETTTTTGTGTYTLAGAVDGFQSFAAIGNGNTCYYACSDGSDYEVGIGTFTLAGTTLARTAILESSNSDAAVNWGAGTKDIFVTLPASKAVFEDASNNVAIGNNITVGGTVDGVDIAARNAVLTSTTTTANAALPKAGGQMTGNITMSGAQTVDGRDLSADGSKLDGIEANADVTDAVNVQAAGALMDSEVTNLAQVKAFDSSDYATAAQGTKADNALPKAGGTMTGNIVMSGAQTVDGRDLSVDGAKLDNIEANATADQTAAEIEAIVNHDNLQGFVSNEHIDWTASGAGTIHATNIPVVALTTVQTAANQAAHLALTAQEGDIVVRSDENKSYVHNGGSAGTMADYTELLTPTDAVLSVNGQTGAVTISNATTSSAGLMSSTDKSKLDGVESGATADQTITAGSGLTGGGTGDVTISHADTSSQASVNGSGRTYIQDITLDTYGHVTAIGTATETVTNTNQLTTFQVEDGDGTEVTISHAKEWKFVEGTGDGASIDINWTDTDNGTDADPYDLTFAVTNTDKGSSQNIFKTFTVTDTDSGYTWAETGSVVADNNSDTVTFVSGGAIDIDVDATNDAIRVTHADTSSQASSNNSGRTYIQDITLDTYGHVTGIATATETVVNTDTNTTSLAIENGSGTSQFTVTDTVGLEFAAGGSASVAFDATNRRVTYSSTDTTYSAGSGLGLSGTTFSHSDTSSQASVSNSGRTYIQSITLDTYGHITAISSGTETVVNTDTNTTSLAIENGSGASQFTVTDTVGLEFAAGGATSVAFDSTNKRVTFSSTDTNTTYAAGSGLTLSSTTFSINADQRSVITQIGQDTNDYISVGTTNIDFVLDGNTDARIENDGDFHADGNVIAYSTTISDPRLKENIKPVTNGLEKVMQLNGYTFDYKADGVSSAGVMSPEVAKVLPSAIKKSKLKLKMGDDNETEYDIVQYDQLTALLIEAIKEQQKQIDELKAKLEV